MAHVQARWLLRSTGGNSARGTALPPIPFRMGGKHFVDNSDFVASAVKDVARLAERGLTPNSRLLDWGCGAGRLAVGILESWGNIARYDGVDVQKRLIEWAGMHIATPNIRFTHVDIANARYNRSGSSKLRIPGDSHDYDALYGYSVLSHMGSTELHAYLGEIRRLVKPGGFAWVTAFVEDNVPNEVVNPQGYGPLEWAGALHCVRYDRTYFESAVAAAALTIDSFEHGDETDGQSLYVLR
jgi:SAM-dependent methyltransferase